MGVRGGVVSGLVEVIAAMTVGLDVTDLFPDMILCMNTPDIELKKLVYLYIINYARVKKNRDTVLLAVNTFVQAAALTRTAGLDSQKLPAGLASCQPVAQGSRSADDGGYSCREDIGVPD